MKRHFVIAILAALLALLVFLVSFVQPEPCSVGSFEALLTSCPQIHQEHAK